MCAERVVSVQMEVERQVSLRNDRRLDDPRFGAWEPAHLRVGCHPRIQLSLAGGSRRSIAFQPGGVHDRRTVGAEFVSAHEYVLESRVFLCPVSSPTWRSVRMPASFQMVAAVRR